ncbi:hypothetical protein [Chryseobacterium arthrosphaerae]|uniref:hypothetical protein n=1 Tax=Chryseobacterium arthrosphaerae TaxID=651561 RepID=UPI001F4BB671|nr:hypothetical protein [Chryseobacterium arthrosphaerae]
MKNFVVTIFALAALTACKKNETPSDKTAENTTMSPPAESVCSIISLKTVQ